MNNTMLIVDDLEMNRSILNLLFEKEYDVIEATSGEEALEILEACSGNIDIILLDLMMPGMGGSYFLKNHRNDPFIKDVPIVVITASETVEDQLEAFQDGANDFIAKPFVPEIVITRVNNIMASTRRVIEMQLEKEALKTQSEIDQMTGLFNKSTAEGMVINELLMYPHGLHALMIIDIDNFKSVNDNEGHLIGDQTIKIIANQIMQSFRKTDIVSRFGGDEFCVFMGNLPDYEIARKKVQELILLMKYKPNLTIPANVSVSIGLTFSKRENNTFEEMFKEADIALYEAKQAGKARAWEYGQNESYEEAEEKDTILLVSRNRSVCSNIQAVLGINYRIIDYGNAKSVSKIDPGFIKRNQMTIIDISQEDDNGAKMLDELLNENEWIKEHPYVSVYREGDLGQVQASIAHNVTDIISEPIDMKMVKRFMTKYLQKDDTETVVIGGLHPES